MVTSEGFADDQIVAATTTVAVGARYRRVMAELVTCDRAGVAGQIGNTGVVPASPRGGVIDVAGRRKVAVQ